MLLEVRSQVEEAPSCLDVGPHMLRGVPNGNLVVHVDDSRNEHGKLLKLFICDVCQSLTYANDHFKELRVDPHSLARKESVHERHNVVSATAQNHKDLLERSWSDFERSVEVRLGNDVQELSNGLSTQDDHSKIGLSTTH